MSSWDDMHPYIDNVSLIVSESYPIGEVLSRLDKLSVSSGTFDYAGRNFDFTISDLTVAADELGITEEMLGYIFAFLDEYGTKTEFDGNSCSVKLKYLGRTDLIERDFVYNYDYGSRTDFLNDTDYEYTYFMLDVSGIYIPDDTVNGFYF